MEQGGSHMLIRAVVYVRETSTTEGTSKFKQDIMCREWFVTAEQVSSTNKDVMF